MLCFHQHRGGRIYAEIAGEIRLIFQISGQLGAAATQVHHIATDQFGHGPHFLGLKNSGGGRKRLRIDIENGISG